MARAPAPHGTPARARKHYRDGEKPCRLCREAATRAERRKNADPYLCTGPDIRETRNGMPDFKPYVYRGWDVAS